MREARAPILIVTGPSGVGKSTVSRLVAATLGEKSTHVRIDEFTRFVVNGWVDPWLPESAYQNEVLGGAVVVAAMQFAEGGYSVVVDGHVFPDSLDELARACLRRDVPLHYVVLRSDLGTCLERATTRSVGERPDPARFAALHARFADLGEHERNVVDATGTPDEVAAAVLAAFRSRRLAESVSPLSGDASAGVGNLGCVACDLADGRLPLPGGLIYATESWRVEHCIGPLGIGTLIVKPARHCEHVADLTASEASELGPLLHQASACVTELCDPDQVYVCLWSHGPVHIHFVIQPVGRGTAHGPRLQVEMFDANEEPNAGEVAAFADRARAWFMTSPTVC